MLFSTEQYQEVWFARAIKAEQAHKNELAEMCLGNAENAASYSEKQHLEMAQVYFDAMASKKESGNGPASLGPAGPGQKTQNKNSKRR